MTGLCETGFCEIGFWGTGFCFDEGKIKFKLAYREVKTFEQLTDSEISHAARKSDSCSFRVST